jgi:hypothetical protein
VQRHGKGIANIEYADDRESALQHQADVGGIVEVYIPGIGWVRWCEAMIEKSVDETQRQ